MTTPSPEEGAAELKWIARAAVGAACIFGLCERDDLVLIAFVVAFVVWVFSLFS